MSEFKSTPMTDSSVYTEPIGSMTKGATEQRSGLMADEREDIGHLITSLNSAAAKSAELSLAPYMLSPLEYRILDRCHRGEANTVTELSRVFPVDASVMSRLVSKLVERKLIGRQRLSSDRRTVRLSLTEEGRFLAQRLAECIKTSQALLMNGVSDDERTAFKATAYKILANLEDRPGSPSAQPERDDAARPGVFHYTAPEAKGLKNGRSNAMAL